jgi:PucR C-terminal helix-turn-helix domain/GGDEF-like domain
VYRPNLQNGLSEVLPDLANRFEERLDAITAENAARQRAEIASLRDLEAPALWEANRRLTRESRRVQAIKLSRGMELPVACPDPDVEAVQLAVRGGLTLAEVLKAYRIGHACTLNAWLDLIEELDIPDSEARSCIAAVSRFVTQYDARLADLVAEEYQRERSEMAAHSDALQLQRFRELIEGHPEAANALGYDLDLQHIGVIAWGVDAEPALHRLARAIDHRLFFVRAEDGLLMGWLGARLEMTAQKMSLLRAFHPPRDGALALGDAHPGYDGLRRTHRQAGAAHVVALKQRRQMTFYSDVAIEALALRDESAAADFISDVLAGIDADDARSAELRDTLSAYFAAEQNATSTAAHLGVHDATITRRLAEIERRTGHRVNKNRAQLETALRLRSLLKGADY